MANLPREEGTAGGQAAVSIKPFVMKDAGSVASLESRLFPSLHPEGRQISRNEIARHILGNKIQVVLVARSGKNFVGFVNARAWKPPALEQNWKGDVFYIDQVAVDPLYRGQGIGKALISSASEIAVRRGHRLLVANINDDSYPFYERTGWSISSEGQEVCWLESPRASNKTLPHPATPYSVASGHYGQQPRTAAGYRFMAFKKLTQHAQPEALFFGDADGPDGAARVFARKVVEDVDFLASLHPSALYFLRPMIRKLYGEQELDRVQLSTLQNVTAVPGEIDKVLRTYAA